MLPYAKDPEGVFTGSGPVVDALLQAIRTTQGR
jgi:hypothetical protein